MLNEVSRETVASLVEVLASIEHERWSHWQRYMHSKCDKKLDGSLVIPPELVERWQRQMETPYSALSEAEKESDRQQVHRYLALVLEKLKIATDAPLGKE